MGGTDEGICKVSRRGTWVPKRQEQALHQQADIGDIREEGNQSWTAPSQRGHGTGSGRSTGRRTRR